MDSSVSPLSDSARVLLDYLQKNCSMRGLARTDRVISAHLGIKKRDLVKISDELLRHKHLVIAETTRPMGRWILLGTNNLQLARDYAAVLESRALGNHVRAKHVLQCVEAREAARLTESNGQGRLFA